MRLRLGPCLAPSQADKLVSQNVPGYVPHPYLGEHP